MSSKMNIPDEITSLSGDGRVLSLPKEIREHMGGTSDGNKLLWYKEEDGTARIAIKRDDDG